MEIRTMQYILTIAKEQNITHAAEKLYITRSALNYCLLNLERDLGFPLFKRVQNKLIPTYSGELYLRQAQRIVTEFHELNHTMEVLGSSEIGRLSIGITVGGGQQILMDIFPGFHRKYPNITLKLVEGNSRQLEQALLTGDIDLAFPCSRNSEPQIDYIMLRPKVRLVLGVAKSNPCVTKYDLENHNGEIIDLNLFKDQYFTIMNKNTFVRAKTDEYFRHANFKPRTMMECSRMNMAIHFANQDIALAFVPENIIDEYTDSMFFFTIEPIQEIVSTLLYRKGTLFTEPENDMIKRIVDFNKVREAPFFTTN